MATTIDASELDTLAIDLGEAPNITRKRLKEVMKKGATNIKEQLIEEMNESRHFGKSAKGLGASRINFDEIASGDGMEYEIGPEIRYGKRSGGANHANIAYFGTSRGGGTVRDPEGALHDEVPSIIGWIEGITEGFL